MSSYLDSLLASLGSTSAYPYPNSTAASRPHVPLLNPATLQAETGRLEMELDVMYTRILAQEEEVRTVQSREEATRTDLDVVVGERDSLRAECEGLYGEIREERRKAETATTRYHAPLLEKNNAIAALQKEKTQLEANISNLRQQLSTGSANETDLTTRLKNATAAFQAEQGSHLRSRKESQEFAKALVAAGTRLDAVLRERDTYRADLEAQRKAFEERLEKAQGALQEKDLLISGMEAEGTKLNTEIVSMLEARDQVSEEKYRKLQETLDEERAKSQEALKHLAESWERENVQRAQSESERKACEDEFARLQQASASTKAQMQEAFKGLETAVVRQAKIAKETAGDLARQKATVADQHGTIKRLCEKVETARAIAARILFGALVAAKAHEKQTAALKQASTIRESVIRKLREEIVTTSQTAETRTKEISKTKRILAEQETITKSHWNEVEAAREIAASCQADAITTGKLHEQQLSVLNQSLADRDSAIKELEEEMSVLREAVADDGKRLEKEKKLVEERMAAEVFKKGQALMLISVGKAKEVQLLATQESQLAEIRRLQTLCDQSRAQIQQLQDRIPADRTEPSRDQAETAEKIVQKRPEDRELALAQDAAADRDAQLKRMEEQIKAMDDRIIRETSRANKATADLKASAKKQIADVNAILKNKNDVIDKLRKEVECAAEAYRHQRKDFDSFRSPPKGPRQRISDTDASQRFCQRVSSKEVDSPSFEMRKPRVEEVKALTAAPCFSPAIVLTIASHLASWNAFGSLASLNTVSKMYRECTLSVLYETVMLDHEGDGARVSEWINRNRDRWMYTRHLSIRKEHAKFIAPCGKTTKLVIVATSSFPKLRIHVEWDSSRPLANGNRQPTENVYLGDLFIHKTISADALHAVLGSIVSSSSNLVRGISAVHCLRTGDITHGSPVQDHHDRFSGTCSVQFYPISKSTLRTLAEITSLAMLAASPRASSPSELGKRALQQKPISLFCKGVSSRHLDGFLRSTVPKMGLPQARNFCVRMEMVPGSTTSEVEDMFALAVNVTRSIWIALPSTKRRPDIRPCKPVLQLYATTSDHLALIGTITPVEKGLPKGLICDLREIVGEGRTVKYRSKGYPRTDTYEYIKDQSVWVTSFDRKST